VWLEHYSAEFTTVEINSTFYHLPRESTFTGWQQRTPVGFLFAVKCWGLITHRKRLQEVEDQLALFLSRARLLGNRLGPVLVQLPPRWQCDLARLRDFLQLLPRELRYAFEFRDLSWFRDAVYDLLAAQGATVVRVSSPSYPASPATAPFCYVRMHGDEDSPKYAPQTLSRWAGIVLTWVSEGREVFVYFNNDIHGYAIADARALLRLVAA
jgi:uncharacterized protein YecE (DUF72 family)